MNIDIDKIKSKYIFLTTAGVVVLAIIVILILIVGRSTKKQPSSLISTVSPIKAFTNANSLFGTMIAFNVNDAAMDMSDAIQKGWTQFRKDNLAYQNLLSNLEKLIQDRTKLVEETGFSLDRASFNYFTWNVIEPQKGQFDWGLTDVYAKGALGAGVKISAVIEPFASWDQKNTQIKANCKMIDAAYYDYKAGAPNDLAEYENFLTKTVERYKNNVAVWEIGNENDAQCGGYENNPQGYFDLLKISSETIKKADPLAIVVNGGASGHSDNSSERSFWTKFFQLGGGQYIDYFNLHYNDARDSSPKLDPAVFQKDLTFWNDLMDKNGGRKPLYLTEFGIYSGSPSSQPTGGGQPVQGQLPPTNQPVSPSQGGLTPFSPTPSAPNPPHQVGQNLPKESLDAQAALYFKDSILVFANGAKVVFIDLIGPDDSVVGSSMMFNTDNQSRPFLVTLKTIDGKIDGFTKVDKIADSQYKFTVGDKTIYALWSGTLPKEIFGNVKVTDIKGQEQIMDAAVVKLSADQPVFVEVQK